MDSATGSSAFTNVMSTDLSPWELPAEWHLEGDSAARGLVISRSRDARVLRGVWEVQPSRFKFEFFSDEMMVIVSGRVSIEEEDGLVLGLGPGDLAFFPAGQRTEWIVHEPLRKAFHSAAKEPHEGFPESTD